ncbi:lytic transglycosylase domain-containing protein [Polyangium jinanense]|uniref:Lytic transglycosylase domain-containing protein n=1 Tax=Polyangium jinanense TaxID=2829994 RepID=A0A9X4ATG0_9BACT|nr:lytic transglycosylase domain-containing protein [Polyangium jinanense]MDC3984154.1 lytic transglycosylase domain-containing protein [Polyangium jinanense]
MPPPDRVLSWPRLAASSFTSARSVLGLLGLGAALLVVPGHARADIYTYTDAQGNVHVTSQPVQAGKSGGKMDRISSGDGTKSRKKAAQLFTVSMPSDRSPERFGRYDSWIREGARLYRLPEELIRAVIKCESDFDPRAVSPTGAQGLMQLMPATALRMQVRDAFDPRENILGGSRYLRVLANMFNGDLELTVAGYNAGENAVMKYQGIPPYEETQGYVGCVVGHYRSFKALNGEGLRSAR